MRVIVVGGSGSKVGKTTLACRLVLEYTEAPTVAMKVTIHEGGEMPRITAVTQDDLATDRGDSRRLLAAGASAVVFVTTGRDVVRSAIAQGLRAARRMRPQLLVIESTAAGVHLNRASESWFVAGDEPWKPWAHLHLAKATHRRHARDVLRDATFTAPGHA